MAESRKCKHCNEIKLIKDYPLHSSTGKPRGVCYDCKFIQDKNRRQSPLYRERSRREREKERSNPELAQKKRDYMRIYYKERRKRDICFRLIGALRCSVYTMITLRRGVTTSLNTKDLVGCSPAFLRDHIRSLWLPGMSWENYGAYRVGGPMTWHIDHIIPCAAFDLSKSEEQRKCFHYTNLQPLWAIDNISKGDNLNWTP